MVSFYTCAFLWVQSVNTHIEYNEMIQLFAVKTSEKLQKFTNLNKNFINSFIKLNSGTMTVFMKLRIILDHPYFFNRIDITSR